jgi:hypothetical protein
MALLCLEWCCRVQWKSANKVPFCSSGRRKARLLCRLHRQGGSMGDTRQVWLISAGISNVQHVRARPVALTSIELWVYEHYAAWIEARCDELSSPLRAHDDLRKCRRHGADRGSRCAAGLGQKNRENNPMQSRVDPGSQHSCCAESGVGVEKVQPNRVPPWTSPGRRSADWTNWQYPLGSKTDFASALGAKRTRLIVNSTDIPLGHSPAQRTMAPYTMSWTCSR